MALIYFDEDYSLTQEMRARNRLPTGARFRLPWEDIKQPLKNSAGQLLIPFFGAGASLVPSPIKTLPKPDAPLEKQISELCKEFGIVTPQSKAFLSVSIQFAKLLDSICQQNTTAGSVGGSSSSQAPSSWELANLLAGKITALDPTGPFEPFQQYADTLSELLASGTTKIDYLQVVKDVARLMNLHHSIPQLLETASFYGERNRYQRQDLIECLRTRFAQVKEATNIQKTFAAIARSFVKPRNDGAIRDKDDYLIITTNYDTLIEDQLTALKVPWCVIHVRREDSYIMSYIPPETKEILGMTPEDFQALKLKYEPSLTHPAARFEPPKNKAYSLAMVYKIHGAPVIPPDRDADNVVISDGDYINFIRRNSFGNMFIPAYVNRKIKESRLLFLGYSFSDWNVRALYEQVVVNRLIGPSSGAKDYIVMKTYRKSDDLFFGRWGDELSVLVTDLDLFADKIR